MHSLCHVHIHGSSSTIHIFHHDGKQRIEHLSFNKNDLVVLITLCAHLPPLRYVFQQPLQLEYPHDGKLRTAEQPGWCQLVGAAFLKARSTHPLLVCSQVQMFSAGKRYFLLV